MAGLAVALDGSWEVGNRPLRFEPDDMVPVLGWEVQGGERGRAVKKSDGEGWAEDVRVRRHGALP